MAPRIDALRMGRGQAPLQGGDAHLPLMSPPELRPVLEFRERRKLVFSPQPTQDFEHQIKEEGRAVLPEVLSVGGIPNFHSVIVFAVNQICC